jgi:type I restriction enzyme S subunit
MEDTLTRLALNIDKSSWELVKFGDVAFEPKETCNDILKEGIEHVVGLEHITTGDIRLRNSATIEESTTFSKKFQAEDVLFGRRRAYLKKAAQASFGGICSGDITVFRAKKDLLPALLPFIVSNDKFFDYAIKHSAGGLSPRVKFKDLANYQFLLPPKEEQAQLAELLWAMEEVIEKEVQILAMLNRTNLILSKRHVDLEYMNDNGASSKNWQILKIKDFAKISAGATPLRSNKDFFENGTFPWVKTLDLNNGRILMTEESITKLALSKTSCKLRPKNTVLIAMYGGFNQIGRTGLLEIEAATNQAISAVIVDQSIILPNYLLLVLNTNINYWKKVAISSRKDPNITKTDVENFPVYLPPLDTQKLILERTESVLESLNVCKSKISASKNLQKSLINQIF